MDTLTVATAMTALAGLGTGLRWRHRARRAEAEAGRLRADLLAEQHAARHDPLTGLPNRRAFHQIGAALLADPARRHVVAAVIDLDDFKQVNDRYGHAVGDEVLIAVARRFAAFAGPDLVARLGGDEFAGLLSCPHTDERWLWQAGRRLAASLAAPVAVSGGTVVVTASVGLTPVHQSSDLDDILRRADEAMYRAKTRADRTACRIPDVDDDPVCHLTMPPVSRAGRASAEPPLAVSDLMNTVNTVNTGDHRADLRAVHQRRAAEVRADADPRARGIPDRDEGHRALTPAGLSAARAAKRYENDTPQRRPEAW